MQTREGENGRAQTNKTESANTCTCGSSATLGADDGATGDGDAHAEDDLSFYSRGEGGRRQTSAAIRRLRGNRDGRK